MVQKMIYGDFVMEHIKHISLIYYFIGYYNILN